MIGSRRTEKCSGCGGPLVVPLFTRTIRCPDCRAVTRVRHHQVPAQQAAGWVKSIFVNGIGSLGSFSGHQWDQPVPAYGSASGTGVPRLPSYPSVHGSKRALLCGVSYVGRGYELKGTVTDVNCMRYLLCERFGFPNESILILTEEQGDPSRIPTKKNMRAAMQWLVRDCRPGDSLVFHFSGHGSQKLDTTGDEADGFDETVCPVDYEANGMIQDDEINATIVHPLPTGAKLHAIVDACHSGTVLDLPYHCRVNRGGFYQWENRGPPSGVATSSGVYGGTSGGLAISFSGCADHQTSADTYSLARSVSTGAMTYSFILAVESEPGPTYGRVLNVMRSVIRGADTGINISGPISSLLRRVFNLGTQDPQLSSSEMFDVYRKPFLL